MIVSIRRIRRDRSQDWLEDPGSHGGPCACAGCSRDHLTVLGDAGSDDLRQFFGYYPANRAENPDPIICPRDG